MSESIVVVGAGVAGLAAAYQLKQAGHDVLILEARNYAGGRMFTVDWEGFKVDGGAKFVTTSDKSMLSIVHEIGLGDQLSNPEEGLRITIFRDGKLHSANFLSIPSYFSWSGVSLGARLAMLKLLPHFLKMGRIRDTYHLEQAPGPDDDVTYEQFFKEKISEEMFEYWAIPMFETMCSYTGEDMSRKAFLAIMVAYMNASTVTFRDGVGVLTGKLASLVNVELTARVQNIDLYPDGSGAKLTYSQNGSTKTVEAARVVVAVPGNHVLSLFGDPHPAWQTFFPTVNYSNGALQYHVCETDYQPPVPSTFVPRLSQLPINSIAFEKYQDGCWLMLTDPRVSLFDMGEKEKVLIERAVEVIRQVFPELKGNFVAHKIFRWSELVPTFRPGYLDSLARFWADPQEGPVYFCGDYFAGPSTGGALYTGLRASERLLQAL
jgi:oxygen-dependent protoporphyrinogen oxidase